MKEGWIEKTEEGERRKKQEEREGEIRGEGGWGHKQTPETNNVNYLDLFAL